MTPDQEASFSAWLNGTPLGMLVGSLMIVAAIGGPGLLYWLALRKVK